MEIDFFYLSAHRGASFSSLMRCWVWRVIQHDRASSNSRVFRYKKLFLVITCLFFILHVEVFDKQFWFLFTYIVTFCHFFHLTFVCTYWLKSTRHCRVDMQFELFFGIYFYKWHVCITCCMMGGIINATNMCHFGLSWIWACLGRRTSS